jgi:glycosyltransferase involved in cell wall biosynthesis
MSRDVSSLFQRPWHNWGEGNLPERIAFISTLHADPWGGSEELWSRAALVLAAEGFPVSASTRAWSQPHPRILSLMESGVEVRCRPMPQQLWTHAWHALTSPKQLWQLGWRGFTEPQRGLTIIEASRFLTARRPGLVVIAEMAAFPPIDLLELCINEQLPFVVIQQANTEWFWVPDGLADRYRIALAAAQRCYFVSRANLRLTEKQIGSELSNAEVVWNPVNVGFNACPAWPDLKPDEEIRFASVARLDPRNKGQDILFEALAQPSWRERKWRLSLYGAGPMKNSLERLSRRLGLTDRVIFAGVARPEDIWASNHVLVMPSRAEGLPLVIVEAMLCGRPVIATDVAGNSEVIEDGVTGLLADAPAVSSFSQALERFWARRADAQKMGEAGSQRIRQVVPSDPARVFSERLKEVLREAETQRSQ